MRLARKKRNKDGVKKMQTKQLPFSAIGDRKLCYVTRTVIALSITDSKVWHIDSTIMIMKPLIFLCRRS